MSSYGSEIEIIEVRDTVQQLLRWAWKYNKNLEEQAAQLHMLNGWSQLVEVALDNLSVFLILITRIICFLSFFKPGNSVIVYWTPLM